MDNQNQTQNNQAPIAPPASSPPASPNKAPPKSSSKLPILIIVILVIIVLLLGGYFVINEMAKRSSAQTPSPTPEEKLQTELTPSPTIEVKEMKTYTSQKLTNISFKGFTLKYPADWTEEAERDDTVGSAKLTLSKNEYSIIIQQGPMGGAQCIYEGVLPEGPANDLRGKAYVDIKTSFGNLRRTEEISGGKMGYSYCQENEQEPGTYGSFTAVGALSSSAPVNADKSILSELDEIIKSIQAL